MNFNEWLQEEHPDFVLDEGWRDWGKKAVIGAALAGSALGMTGCSGGTCDVPQSGKPVASQQQADVFNYNFAGPRKASVSIKVLSDHGEATVKMLGNIKSELSNMNDKLDKTAKQGIFKAAGMNRGHIADFGRTNIQQQGGWIIATYHWTTIE